MRLVDLYWPVAQMVERLTVNQMVAGSSPAGSAILRGAAVVAYQPHKLVVAGSSPAPARDTFDKPPRGVSWVVLIIKKEGRMGYIYKICNDINDKVYVGKTFLTVEKRFQEHLCDANKRRNENRPLYSAIRKYGKKHFYVELIEECDDAVLSEREQFWIERFDCFRNGYNATHGGDGKTQFDHDLIFEELLFCPYANIVAEKIGCSVDLVRHIAHEHGLQVESRSQISMKEQKSKRIMCESDNLYFIFDSIADAARWLKSAGIVKNLSSGVRSHISDCARGKRMNAYGFKWRYT